ncbi:MAG: galactose mutarotase, partial [Flavobacterium sp.]|nr:galactose mutarotase [Flavobacterium sp.]
SLSIINYGATITNLFVPDRNGNLIDIIVGLKQPEDYIGKPYSKVKLYLGSSIGRYAGRISKGQFQIKTKTYKINHKDGVHLHGGKGFDERFWNIEELKENSVTMSYFSVHLEEGYPGNLKVYVKYELTDDNTLNINYTATSDEVTPVNLTSHPYLNLNGQGSVLAHELFINSNQYLEVDEKLLPTGKILDSKNTPFDRTNVVSINKK